MIWHYLVVHMLFEALWLAMCEHGPGEPCGCRWDEVCPMVRSIDDARWWCIDVCDYLDDHVVG